MRTGRKNRACFRIVVQDVHSRRDGPALDNLGTYDPLLAENPIKVDADKVKEWVGKGAQVSDKLASLLKKAGVQTS